MMKKFILVVCGSFVGVCIALAVITISAIIMSIVMFASLSKSSKALSVSNNSILELKLSGTIEERSSEANPFELYAALSSGENNAKSGLNTLIAALRAAKTNDKIKGVSISCEGVSASPATLQRLRRAVADFKKSGKFIYAFGNEGITQNDYYIASVADSIFLNPYGSVDIHGFASGIPYMKGLMDKVGVKMQVVRVGTFKSAVEPYMLEHMSEANRLQTEHYLGKIWGDMSDSIAISRGISKARLKSLTDSVLITADANELLKEKLVDKLCYKQEYQNKLRSLMKLDKTDDLKLTQASDLAGDIEQPAKGSHIAVLYAVGEIDGSTNIPMGQNDGINSEKLAEQVRKLSIDDNVKGLVLRVNSPGGSAFGSEVLWKALEDFKKTGKPFAVSMGDLAASGGYYISCGAGRIFAEPTTITGSIGIFGMIPDCSELVTDKLGVNVEVVQTNPNAIAGSPLKPLTEQQTAALQKMVNRGYELFTSRCAKGRKMTQDSIKSIAEGRVWDGITAKSIGLVDEYGSIDEAVKWVAQQAKLKDGDYTTQNYPNKDDEFKEMLANLGASVKREELKREMGIFYTYYEQLNAVLNRRQILCLMEPVEFY